MDGAVQERFKWDTVVSDGPEGYADKVLYCAELKALRICFGGRCVTKPLDAWVEMAWPKERLIQERIERDGRDD